MNVVKPFQIVVIACLLAGCSAVYSTQPVGVAPASIKPQEWDGTWIHKDGSLTLKVLDSEEGVVQVAWIENMKLASHKAYLLESGEWMFGNVKEDENQSQFLWGRIKKRNNQIIIWTPSVSKIAALVKDGSLPGTVDDGGDVMLGNLTANHLTLITSEDKDVLFEWEDPLVVIRIAK